MTAGRAVEQRITRQLVNRRLAPRRAQAGALAERLIALAAVATLSVLLASFAQDLLWLLMAGATVWVVGARSR